jgi:Mrp family chromosome partitioning ATPase
VEEARLDTPDDAAWATTDDSPFVEIGGPSGPIFSHTPPVPPRPAAVEPRPEPKREPERAFPRLVPSPAAPSYLSVRFHDILTRAPGKPGSDGPDPSLVALYLPDHPVSAEYRTLRDEIARQIAEATSRVLFFTAPAPEAGATTVLLNLAVTLAREGKTRVLVVDGNVHRPGIASRLGIKSSPGLCEILAHQVPLTWALQPTAIPGLQALAAGEPTEATTTAICRDFPRLLSQLRQWFDWVLVDAGAWGGMAERDAACPAADAVYLVAREADSASTEFTAVRGWVKELGGLLRGYITTRT